MLGSGQVATGLSMQRLCSSDLELNQQLHMTEFLKSDAVVRSEKEGEAVASYLAVQ